MISLTEKGLFVQTATTRLEFDGTRITSIQDATTGEEFINRDSGKSVPGFDLIHQNGKISPLGVHPLASQVHYTLLTDHIAEIVLNDWECDVSLRISEDQATGDILIEPSAWTMQGGVYGIGMNVSVYATWMRWPIQQVCDCLHHITGKMLPGPMIGKQAF
jgi:hypothetical protein